MSTPPVSVSKLLLSAVEAMKTDDVAPSVRDLELHLSGTLGLKLGPKIVENTVKNLKRHGALRIVRTRRVAYRNRPVAEYDVVPPQAQATEANNDDGLARVLSAWVQR